MLSSVLRSKRAIQVNIAIMPSLARLTEMLATHKDLADKFTKLEQEYDERFRVVFDAIRQLMAPSMANRERRKIGFSTDDEGASNH